MLRCFLVFMQEQARIWSVATPTPNFKGLPRFPHVVMGLIFLDPLRVGQMTMSVEVPPSKHFGPVIEEVEVVRRIPTSCAACFYVESCAASRHWHQESVEVKKLTSHSCLSLCCRFALFCSACFRSLCFKAVTLPLGSVVVTMPDIVMLPVGL